MRRFMRTAGVLAGIALCCLASPVRAEFSMSVRENGVSGNPGFLIDETSPGKFTLTTYGGVKPSDVTWTANDGTIHAIATVDGYKFNVYALSNQDAKPTPTTGSVGFGGTVTPGAGAKATSFSYYAADSPFTFPGTSTSKLLLVASVWTKSDFTAGDRVQAQAHYTAYGANPPPTTNYLTQTAALTQPNQSASSPPVVISTRGSQYALSDLGGIVETNGHVGKISFWSQAVTAMPEPTGLLIALFGVPCMGLVVVVARRRLARIAAVA